MIAQLLEIKVYAIVAAVSLALGFGVGFYIQATRFAKYRGEVEAIGREAKARAAEKEASDKALKEKVDAEHSAVIARLNVQLKRLRDARSSVVPEAIPAPASSGGVPGPSGRICFNGGKFRERVGDVAAALRARIAASAERYAPVVAGYEACAAWAIETRGGAP